MAADAGPPAEHEHAPAPTGLPAAAWGLVSAVLLVVGLAWAITWRTADAFDELVMLQLRGAAPADTLLYLLLSGVMMVAMMLPSALPMVATYRGLAARDEDGGPAGVRTGLFTIGYVAVWAFFTSVALVVLAALGWMGGMSAGRFVPGALLVAAGLYQFTAWKAFCLNHCRTPVGFVMHHWRSGAGGAFRMGSGHAVYCLGCCWLLMLVLFVAGAMSILWMGLFAGLVLVEKVGSRGLAFARVTGIVSVVVGALVLGFAFLRGDGAGAGDGMEMARAAGGA
jgi:predicted metal-binding membrane protein